MCVCLVAASAPCLWEMHLPHRLYVMVVAGKKLVPAGSPFRGSWVPTPKEAAAALTNLFGTAPGTRGIDLCVPLKHA